MAGDDCVFCKIARGESPAFRVFEDERFCAFLAPAPHRPGHTLVIPKTHIDDFTEMDNEHLERVLTFAQPIVRAIKRAFRPNSGKVGLMVAGLMVRHAHLHLIPLDELEDLNTDRANRNVAAGELDAARRALTAELSTEDTPKILPRSDANPDTTRQKI